VAGQLATLALGVVVLCSCTAGAGAARTIAGIFAVLWAFVAWAFLWKRYASINWRRAISHGCSPSKRCSWQAHRSTQSRLRRQRGVGLSCFSLAVYPMLAPLWGRGWSRRKCSAWAPIRRMLATLGLLLLAEQPPPLVTLVVPLAWCLMSGALLWAMGSPEVWILVMRRFSCWGHVASRGPTHHP